jgi:hypothetical protein
MLVRWPPRPGIIGDSAYGRRLFGAISSPEVWRKE